MTKKGRLSAPYREVSSKLKRLLSEGGIIEGPPYRADRGNSQRHQLPDRATGKFRNIYVPADFAPVVAEWSARWAEAKRLMKEMSELVLWQLFNSGCLLPLQKQHKYRNMTRMKWAEMLRL